jgi:transposase
LLTLCLPRHRHNEFLAFLKIVNAHVPRGLDVHVIVDNSSTHTHLAVRAWLARHRRVTLHFTPTSSSWLNLVELWFRQITNRRIRRAAFPSVEDLIGAIGTGPTTGTRRRPSSGPRPPSRVLAKVRTARAALTHHTKSATHQG